MSNRKRKQTPPSAADINHAAEQYVLGCVLRRDTVYFEIQNHIAASDFSDPRHTLIFETIGKLAAKSGGRFDAVTVASFLTDPEANVTRDYLDALADVVSDPSAVMTYVRTVVDLARTRSMVAAMEQGIARLRLRAPDEPLNETVDAISAEVLDAGRADSVTQRTLGEYAEVSFKRIDTVRTLSSTPLNLRWGLSAIDTACGPAIPGHITVLGGRSEMGKTALALGVAHSFGEQAPGAIFELEMMGEGIADRSLSRITGIPAWKITRNEARSLDDMERFSDAVEKLHRLPIWIEARPALTAKQIRAKAIGLKRRHGCRWFIVDHLQIIASEMQRGRDPAETIDSACMIFAATAKETESHWILLSQTNSQLRDRDNDRPRSRDLMYYNAIEPHADAIVFPYRPEVAIRERRPPEPAPGDTKAENLMANWESQLANARGKAEIVCTKNRHGESGVIEQCQWNGSLMSFEPLSYRATKSGERQYQAEF